MHFIIYFLLTFPVFSLTSLIGFARLHNVAIAILLIGAFEIAAKKAIKLNPTLVYCWFIAFGMGSSIALRLIFEGQSNVSEWVFPLIWILLPFFLSYWRRFASDLAKFTEYFFLINFIYAFFQILASRIFGYSLMIHRLFSDYQIESYAQDTPFRYLGLNTIHQFISARLGAAATGLVIERIDLMFLCIICISRMNLLNYPHQLNDKPKNKFILLSHINIILGIILITICGSSLSIFILLLPFLSLVSYYNTKLSFSIKLLKLSKTQKALTLSILFIFIILLILFYLFNLFSEIVGAFDMSARIIALHKFSFLLADFSSYFSQFVYGNGVISTANIEIASSDYSLLPRSLDVFGYTFNSFGLLGLVPFLSCYPLLLRSQTSLKWPAIVIFCGLVFTGAGSPLSYIYTYALILSRPNQVITKQHTTKFKISNV